MSVIEGLPPPWAKVAMQDVKAAVARLQCSENETHRITQAIKQLAFGWSTKAHLHYLSWIAAKEQPPHGYSIPPDPVSLTRRDFMKRVREWRQWLHNYDHCVHSAALARLIDSPDEVQAAFENDRKRRLANQRRSSGGGKRARKSGGMRTPAALISQAKVLFESRQDLVAALDQAVAPLANALSAELRHQNIVGTVSMQWKEGTELSNAFAGCCTEVASLAGKVLEEVDLLGGEVFGALLWRLEQRGTGMIDFEETLSCPNKVPYSVLRSRFSRWASDPANKGSIGLCERLAIDMASTVLDDVVSSPSRPLLSSDLLTSSKQRHVDDMCQRLADAVRAELDYCSLTGGRMRWWQGQLGEAFTSACSAVVAEYGRKEALAELVLRLEGSGLIDLECKIARRKVPLYELQSRFARWMSQQPASPPAPSLHSAQSMDHSVDTDQLSCLSSSSSQVPLDTKSLDVMIAFTENEIAGKVHRMPASTAKAFENIFSSLRGHPRAGYQLHHALQRSAVSPSAIDAVMRRFESWLRELQAFDAGILADGVASLIDDTKRTGKRPREWETLSWATG